MNYRIRKLPSLETIEKNVKKAGVRLAPEAAALTLSLLNCASRVQEEIIAPLEREGLSEGKFLLLMALREQPLGLGVRELALRVGVTPPTMSIMLRRMRQAPKPLVRVERLADDARARRVQITSEGIELIGRIFPGHLKRVAAFSERLSGQERRELARLLLKLSDPADDE
ncbi:MAG: hypothetical protein MR428_03555 [Mesosutterella sp.]|nr:hypothetical protein [Mesosutterella sp.]